MLILARFSVRKHKLQLTDDNIFWLEAALLNFVASWVRNPLNVSNTCVLCSRFVWFERGWQSAFSFESSFSIAPCHLQSCCKSCPVPEKIQILKCKRFKTATFCVSGIVFFCILLLVSQLCLLHGRCSSGFRAGSWKLLFGPSCTVRAESCPATI